MPRYLPIAALTLASAAGSAAYAQVGSQGPVLFPPSPNEQPASRGSNAFGPSSSRAGSSDQRYNSPYYLGGSNFDVRPRVPNVVAPEVDTAPIRDPQIAQIAQWYRDFFNRPMAAIERNNWEVYLRGDGGNLDNVLVQLVGGDEFYKQSGENFDSWLRELAKVANTRLSAAEAAQWRNISRGGDRLTFARQFLTAEGVLGGGQFTAQRPPIANNFTGHDHGHEHFGSNSGYRQADYGRSGYGQSGYVGSSSPFDGIVRFQGSLPGSVGGQLPGSRYVIPHYLSDDHHDGHEHSVGYGPRPAGNSAPDAISGWYNTYFGRAITPGELNKWLSDLDKGMSIDEVYASVLAAPEWYNRAGGSPQQWIGSTLAALGQPNDTGSISYWVDRYRRHGNDRFRTALEMVRARPQQGLNVRDDDNRRRDRRDRHFDHDD